MVGIFLLFSVGNSRKGRYHPMDDLLSSSNVIALAALAGGALALLKRHWYRSAQFLFLVAMLLADAKVLRWALTSEVGLKTQIIGGSVGITLLTFAFLWAIRMVQREIANAAAEAKFLAPLFGNLTDFEKAVLRQIVLVGRSTRILNAAEPTLISIEGKTGFITRTFVGHYELNREVKEPLQALLANDRSSLVSAEPGISLAVAVKSEGRELRTFRNNEIAGEQNRALEGFEVHFEPPIQGLSLEYMGHFEMAADVPYVNEGEFLSGGEAWQLEGFAIKLTGIRASAYDVFYSAHAEGFGNYDECTNGKFCGSRQRGRSLDTIVVRVVSHEIN
jgi:hypothetical protein